ncbi:GNAT family N-acetyltransferase [Tenacibaculum sp. SZ-18]|uniref:GNAT family N-acetyltransferase n=1 Tax=Tenacibaculum sp. SZ-18 TaxID=754423 RepID=UPI000C2D1B1F|nr:GNAT family N-acetyltransferase [Tenacibaculum sp. SZ-18]AUC16439.1 GNAT family N-acetyltransferase [Tenacibaculum sp. SZ-18]
MLIFTQTSTETELHQILGLQQKNLPKVLSDEEKKQEGFVTVEHDFETLFQMHEIHPHIIAKYNDKVVGYALSMSTVFKDSIPALIPMFTELEKLNIDQNFIIMGQVCVDKEHRGKGIFRSLYEKMSAVFTEKYSSIITEIDAENIRSINAHKAIGFKTISEYPANNQVWKIVAMEI